MRDYRISETDWKRWVHLADDVLDRHYDKVLAEAGRLPKAPGSRYERYQKLKKLVENSEDVIAEVTDEQRRTTAVLQIVAALREGLITDRDLKPFSQETRAAVEHVKNGGGIDE